MHPLVLHNRILDLVWRDLLATSLNELLLTALDCQMALVVEQAYVAREEEGVLVAARGTAQHKVVVSVGVKVVEVLLHDRWSGDSDDPFLTVRKWRERLPVNDCQ